MLYELRFYEILPGKMPNYHGRQDAAMKALEKLGVKTIGVWTQDVGTSNQLVYLLAFQDAAHRDRAWAEFGKDPGWQKALAESERDGPVVARLVNHLLKPTPYSPLK